MDKVEGGAGRPKGQAAIASALTRFALVFSVATVFSTATQAQGEHERRLAAELVVMAGDVRRLAGEAELPRHRGGLRLRLAGALSSLPLLLRRAGGDVTPVAALRSALLRSDWLSLHAVLIALQRKHPLDLRGLLMVQPTPELLRLGGAIHLQTCAGCHDAPATDADLPAFNLFEQIRRMPQEEFAARLLIGVRGDRSTAWHNPFSDLELGALIAYYNAAHGIVSPPQRK